MLKKYNYLNLLLLIPFGFGLFVAINDGIILGFERGIFDALRNLAPFANIPMRALTELGSAVGVIAITSLIFLITLIFNKHFFEFGLPVTIVAIISRVINITIKNILMRERPDFKVMHASESSFPSGHSQNNMALYIAILITFLLIVNAPKIRTWLKIGCIVIPIIIGITRLYFGVHYFTDVIAGWSLGAIVAYNVIYFYFKIYRRITKEDDSDKS